MPRNRKPRVSGPQVLDESRLSDGPGKGWSFRQYTDLDSPVDAKHEFAFMGKLDVSSVPLLGDVFGQNEWETIRRLVDYVENFYRKCVGES